GSSSRNGSSRGSTIACSPPFGRRGSGSRRFTTARITCCRTARAASPGRECSWRPRGILGCARETRGWSATNPSTSRRVGPSDAGPRGSALLPGGSGSRRRFGNWPRMSWRTACATPLVRSLRGPTGRRAADPVLAPRRAAWNKVLASSGLGTVAGEPLVQEYGLFIGGKWRKSEGKRFDTRNPATGEILATFPLATKEELGEAVRTAKGVFEKWRKTPAPRRGELLLEA